MASSTSTIARNPLIIRARLKPEGFTVPGHTYQHRPQFGDNKTRNAAEKLEVLTIAPSSTLQSFYDEVTTACRSVAEDESHKRWTRRWIRCNKIDVVHVLWDYKEDADAMNLSGGGVTVIHEKNFDGVMELLRERKGLDVLLLSIRSENLKIPAKKPAAAPEPLTADDPGLDANEQFLLDTQSELVVTSIINSGENGEYGGGLTVTNEL